jgi:hypothetical protein
LVPAGEGGGEEQAGADDLLAAFRDTATDSSVGDLTKEIDDVPIEELLAGLREVRSMLPATSGVDD